MNTDKGIIRIIFLVVLFILAVGGFSVVLVQRIEGSKSREVLCDSIWTVIDESNGEDCGITMSFSKDGTDRVVISGFTGVNYYSGTFRIFGHKLSIDGDIMLTKMAGPSDLMERESGFIELLKHVDFCKFVGKTENEVLFTFGKERIFARKYSISGKEYLIQIPYEDGVDTEKLPYISFMENSEAMVYTGINYVGGVYVFIPEAGSFEFVSGLSTMALGAPEEVAAEEKILSLLASCESFGFENGTIFLFDGEKNNVLNLVEK